MYIQNYAHVKSNQTVRSSIAASIVPPVTPQVAANLFRQKLCLFNASATLKFYVAFGTTPGAVTDYTVTLNPGDYFEELSSVDALSVVSNGTSLSDLLYVTEMS